MKTLAEQIECAKSELHYRRGYYPELVAHHSFTPQESAHSIECMEAIVESLKNLEAFQQLLK